MKKTLLALLAIFLIPVLASAECRVPDSSWIREVCYVSPSKTTANLNGRQYTFCGVPRPVFDAWTTAVSPGRYFNLRVKGRYQCP